MFDIANRLDNKPESHGRRLRTAIILFLTLSAQTSGLSWATEGQQYRADEWITECDPIGGQRNHVIILSGNPKHGFAQSLPGTLLGSS